MSAQLEAALRYAAHGWPVMPAHTPADERCSCGKADCASAAKHPRTAHGLTDATTDRSTVARWWGEMWPDANIAVRTGEQSGLVVIDVDGDEGADSLHELQRCYQRLPTTATVKTPGGGTHLYFTHPGGTVPNSVGMLAHAVDVRGDGGYVLVPPSIGMNGRRYEVDERAGPAPLPDWLRCLIVADPDRRERAPASD